jgi:hypothetical protein
MHRYSLLVLKKCLSSLNVLINQCDQIGRNFAIWVTFYKTNFHLTNNLELFVKVISRFQKLFDVVDLAFKLSFDVNILSFFGYFFPKIGQNFIQFICSRCNLF